MTLMQFNPLFLSQASPEQPAKLNFKLSGSTHLFADILRVYSDQENVNPEISQGKIEPSIQGEPVDFSMQLSLNKSNLHSNIKDSGEVIPVNLKSIVELVDELSYPLSEKGFLVKNPDIADDNIETADQKKYISGVELNEIIKKLAYLTGAISFNQFVNDNDSFISVKDKSGSEIKVSTKDLLNFLNSNETAKINIDSDYKSLSIELRKIDTEKLNQNADFVLFNEDADSLPDLEKIDLKNTKVSESKTPGEKINLPLSPEKNNNISQKDISQTIVPGKIILGEKVKKTEIPEIKLEKEIKNQVYEVKLELTNKVTKTDFNISNEKEKINFAEQDSKSFKHNLKQDIKFPAEKEKDIINETESENVSVSSKKNLRNHPKLYHFLDEKSIPLKNKSDISPDRIFKIVQNKFEDYSDISKPDNGFNNPDIREIKSQNTSSEKPILNGKVKFTPQEVIDIKNELPKSETIKNSLKIANINPAQYSEDESKITQVTHSNKQFSKEVELNNSSSSQTAAKKDIPVSTADANEGTAGDKQKKFDREVKIKNPVKVNEEFESKINLPGKESSSAKLILEDKAIHLNSDETVVKKQSGPEKDKVDQSLKIEKESPQKISYEQPNRGFENNSQGNHQSNLFVPAPDKFTEVKNLSTTQFLSSELFKEVPVEKIYEEITKLATNEEKKNIVLKIVPEHMGKVKVSLHLSENAVHANLEVENETVRNVIQNNSENLRNSLMQQGLQLSSLNISLSNNEQKTGKSFSSKKKMNFENAVDEVDEKDNKVYKKFGYNTYEYLA